MAARSDVIEGVKGRTSRRSARKSCDADDTRIVTVVRSTADTPAADRGESPGTSRNQLPSAPIGVDPRPQSSAETTERHFLRGEEKKPTKSQHTRHTTLTWRARCLVCADRSSPGRWASPGAAGKNLGLVAGSLFGSLFACGGHRCAIFRVAPRCGLKDSVASTSLRGRGVASEPRHRPLGRRSVLHRTVEHLSQPCADMAVHDPWPGWAAALGQCN